MRSEDLPSGKKISENDWSPLQFGLSHLFVLVVMIAVGAAIVRRAGPEAIFPTIVVFCAIGFIAAAKRIFLLSGREDFRQHDEKE